MILGVINLFRIINSKEEILDFTGKYLDHRVVRNESFLTEEDKQSNMKCSSEKDKIKNSDVKTTL